MTDTEVSVNPIYGDMLRIVNEAMQSAGIIRVSPCPDVVPPCRLRQVLHLDECLPNDYPFKPTWHEVSALLCGDIVINAQHQSFLNYASNLPRTVDPVQVDTLEAFAHCASRFPRMLRWALLLHDIAKDRYPRLQGQDDPNPSGAEHPKLCKTVVELISPDLIKRSEKLGECCLVPGTCNVVLWLVENHDILGNMFTGERAPRFLLDPALTPGYVNVEQWLPLLQVVTLCDLWATADGRFLTEQKAQYWRTLGDTAGVVRRQHSLYDWRVQRWTGDLVGGDDLEKINYVKKELENASKGLRLTAEKVFGDGIDHVVYGFYLFTALSKEELAGLLVLLLQAYNKLVPAHVPSITLTFEKYKPWESDTAKVLDAYRSQITDTRLTCQYISGTQILKVVV